MCRWIAYIGQPIFIDQVVTIPSHSLVQQSFDTKMRYSSDGTVLNLNGDGFGVGWYSEKTTPGLYKDDLPAWGSRNLRNICEQIKAHIFFAHIRASTTGAVQRSNSHPFQYKQWLFQHNGHIDHFDTIKQDLHCDIAPHIYPELKGTTDSETFFLLALTYGLETDPKKGLQKAVERIREACEDAKIKCIVNFSCSISDGENIYTLRYAENEKANTQFFSTDYDLCKTANMPDGICPLPGNYVVVVSEPLDQLSNEWTEVPDNTFATVRDGKVSFETFI